jgi:glycerophosphoryl diester phosphodiesterase
MRNKRHMLAFGAALFSANLWADCNGMQLFAHRGAPGAPENSSSAIQLAIEGQWDGVEVDLQRLRSGQWVLHHDPLTGRTTSLSGVSVQDIDKAAWQKVRMKNRQGLITDEPAPFMKEILDKLRTRTTKTFNAEIKQESACGDVQKLVRELTNGLPQGNWFLTSISRRSLACARQIDPKRYYGIIVLDPKSIATQAEQKSRWAAKIYPSAQSPIVDKHWIEQLTAQISPPVGIHADVLTVEANPSMLTDATSAGVPVLTYSLNGDGEHARILKAQMLRSNFLPSGAIIDGDPSSFCKALGFQLTTASSMAK